MEPTLQDGETVLAAMLWPPPWLRRGSIVLIQRTGRVEGSPSCLTIKRVAYLPGDRVTWHPELAGNRPQSSYGMRSGAQVTQTLKRDEVFVLSDNLAGGFDSRSWGPLQASTLVGIVLLRVASPRPTR